MDSMHIPVLARASTPRTLRGIWFPQWGTRMYTVEGTPWSEARYPTWTMAPRCPQRFDEDTGIRRDMQLPLTVFSITLP